MSLTKKLVKVLPDVGDRHFTGIILPQGIDSCSLETIAELDPQITGKLNQWLLRSWLNRVLHAVKRRPSPRVVCWFKVSSRLLRKRCF